jgi:hypothetical protein
VWSNTQVTGPATIRQALPQPAGALPGYDYDVLSEELLLEKLVFADGKLRLPSGMNYQVLTIPDHRVLSLGALRKIDALARAGANILGPKPRHAVSLEGGPQGVLEFDSSPMACGAMREQNPAPGPLAKAALRGA